MVSRKRHVPASSQGLEAEDTFKLNKKKFKSMVGAMDIF